MIVDKWAWKDSVRSIMIALMGVTNHGIENIISWLSTGEHGANFLYLLAFNWTEGRVYKKKIKIKFKYVIFEKV